MFSLQKKLLAIVLLLPSFTQAMEYDDNENLHHGYCCIQRRPALFKSHCPGFLEFAEELFGKQTIQDAIKKNPLMVRLSIEPDEKLKYLPHDITKHCSAMSFFIPYHFLEKKKKMIF
jgi:hypothetical protein